MNPINKVWLEALEDLITRGNLVSPRGNLTREIPQRTICVDTRRCVLTVPARKLGYKFMAAEAYWILTGDNRVETIAPYSKNITNFSDDGETFFGAYGPKINSQLDYILRALRLDRDTRQAGLTIWRENPPKSKDIPCTVAIFFSIRGQQLNCHVFMRSSDIWLGVPYDVFNFSMLTHLVCAYYNYGHGVTHQNELIYPGNLYLTAASSHIYEANIEQAKECLNGPTDVYCGETPEEFFDSMDPNNVIKYLEKLKDSEKGSPLRWWGDV